MFRNDFIIRKLNSYKYNKTQNSIEKETPQGRDQVDAQAGVHNV